MKDLINKIILESNKKRYLYHGIKNPELVDNILEQGLKPLTPESKPCSFWATGKALFYPTYDSPFYNYSGNCIEPDYTELNIAVTIYDLLYCKDIVSEKYVPDSQIKIQKIIPPDIIALISVGIMHPQAQNHKELRTYRKKAEQELLNAILEQLDSFNEGLNCYLLTLD